MNMLSTIELTGDQLYRDDYDADRQRRPAGLVTACTLPALLRETAAFTESVQAMCRGHVQAMVTALPGGLLARSDCLRIACARQRTGPLFQRALGQYVRQ